MLLELFICALESELLLESFAVIFTVVWAATAVDWL
jgi:hypothetical protein